MRRNLGSTATPELIAIYARAAAEHGEASEAGDVRRTNSSHDIVADVYCELRQRGAEAQFALLPLLGHENDAVKCWAASHALQFAPAHAEPVLTQVARGRGLLAFSARQTLREWRKGNLSFVVPPAEA